MTNTGPARQDIRNTADANGWTLVTDAVITAQYVRGDDIVTVAFTRSGSVNVARRSQLNRVPEAAPARGMRATVIGWLTEAVPSAPAATAAPARGLVATTPSHIEGTHRLVERIVVELPAFAQGERVGFSQITTAGGSFRVVEVHTDGRVAGLDTQGEPRVSLHRQTKRGTDSLSRSSGIRVTITLARLADLDPMLAAVLADSVDLPEAPVEVDPFGPLSAELPAAPAIVRPAGWVDPMDAHGAGEAPTAEHVLATLPAVTVVRAGGGDEFAVELSDTPRPRLLVGWLRTDGTLHTGLRSSPDESTPVPTHLVRAYVAGLPAALAGREHRTYTRTALALDLAEADEEGVDVDAPAPHCGHGAGWSSDCSTCAAERTAVRAAELRVERPVVPMVLDAVRSLDAPALATETGADAVRVLVDRLTRERDEARADLAQAVEHRDVAESAEVRMRRELGDMTDRARAVERTAEHGRVRAAVFIRTGAYPND